MTEEKHKIESDSQALAETDSAKPEVEDEGTAESSRRPSHPSVRVLLSLPGLFVVSLVIHLIALYALYLVVPKQEPSPEETVTISLTEEPLKDEMEIKKDKEPPVSRAPKAPLAPDAIKPQIKPPKKQLKKPLKPQKPKNEAPLQEVFRPKAPKRLEAPDVPEETISKKAPSGSTDEGLRENTRNSSASSGRGAASARIFDQSVIDQLARREVEKELAKKPSIGFDTKDMRYKVYMDRLRETIESTWDYPVEAARNGIQGELVIRFIIGKDGSLAGAEIVRTSGFPMLDEAALKALRDAEPYWPLPESWQTEEFSIEGRFVYSLYRTYIN